MTTRAIPQFQITQTTRVTSRYRGATATTAISNATTVTTRLHHRCCRRPRSCHTAGHHLCCCHCYSPLPSLLPLPPPPPLLFAATAVIFHFADAPTQLDATSVASSAAIAADVPCRVNRVHNAAITSTTAVAVRRLLPRHWPISVAAVAIRRHRRHYHLHRRCYSPEKHR